MSRNDTDRWVCRCDDPVVDHILRDEAYCGLCKKRIEQSVQPETEAV